jgi:uncharacterized protein (DUF4415 family)
VAFSQPSRQLRPGASLFNHWVGQDCTCFNAGKLGFDDREPWAPAPCAKNTTLGGLEKIPMHHELKKQITIRLDEDAITYFKSVSEEVGIPYQSLIYLYLRDCQKRTPCNEAFCSRNELRLSRMIRKRSRNQCRVK